jgi:hypothetical protein
VTVAALDKPFLYRLIYFTPWCCDDASPAYSRFVLGKRNSQMNPSDRFSAFLSLSHRIRAAKSAGLLIHRAVSAIITTLPRIAFPVTDR